MSEYPANQPRVHLNNENVFAVNDLPFEDQQDFYTIKLPFAEEQMQQGAIVSHGPSVPQEQTMSIPRQDYPQPSGPPRTSWQAPQPPSALPNHGAQYPRPHYPTVSPQSYVAAGQPFPYANLPIAPAWQYDQGQILHPSQVSPPLDQGNNVHRHGAANPRATVAVQPIQRPVRHLPQPTVQAHTVHDDLRRVQKSGRAKGKSPKSASGRQCLCLVLEDFGDSNVDFLKFMQSVTDTARENFSYTDSGIPKVSFAEFSHYILQEAKAVPASARKDDDDGGTPGGRMSSVGPSVCELTRSKQRIAEQYRGYQKEFRLKIPDEERSYKCTLGCGWSHGTKANWERHERSHYPQEIWLCCHEGCLEKETKARVSFRKDLARRHHEEHHKAKPTDRQLETFRIKVSDSLFPRHCVFDGCSTTFETFDERLNHIERHLFSLHTLDRSKIHKIFLADQPVKREPTDSPELGGMTVEEQQRFDEDQDPGPSNRDGQQDDEEDANGDSDDDSDEDDDEDDNDNNDNQHNGRRKDDDQDPSPGPGAPGAPGGANNLLWPSDSQFGMYDSGGPSMGGGGDYPTTLDFSGTTNYCTSPDFSEKRSWKALAALRLQILPHALAHGISKTPIVLKRIQLQATLALESKGMKQTQAIHVLKREIAMMTHSVIKSSPRTTLPFVGLGAAVTDVLPLVARTMMLPQSVLQACQSDTSFNTLSRAENSTKLEDTEDSLHGSTTKESSTTELRPLARLNGKQLYQFIRNPYRSRSWRPSRLIHVGSRRRPTLHLDVSEAIPTNAEYCSVAHSWENGPGIWLTNHNINKLQQSIPIDRLDDTMQNAISFAREKGVEYVWIDTLCIIQDSVEDWRCEGPNLDQIYNSASYSIVVTTTALSDTALQEENRQSSAQCSKEELSLSNPAKSISALTSIPETPGLTTDWTENETTDLHSSRSSSEYEDSLKALGLQSQKRKMIRYSPQIMVRTTWEKP